MRTLLALLLLIPSLSWGNIINFKCKADSDTTYYKTGEILTLKELRFFDMKINENNDLIEFNSDYPVGGKFITMEGSKFYYDSLKYVNINVYLRSAHLWFDGLKNFTYTKSDLDKVRVFFASCNKN